MVRSHAAAGAAITGNAYAAAKATGTAATASGRIAGTPHAPDARVRDGPLQQELAAGIAYGKADDEAQCTGPSDSVLCRDWYRPCRSRNHGAGDAGRGDPGIYRARFRFPRRLPGSGSGARAASSAASTPLDLKIQPNLRLFAFELRRADTPFCR